MMNWRQIALYILLFIHGVQSSTGQELQITSISFPTSDLPASISSIVQDNFGNLWIGDIAFGLYKYDGVKISRYRNERNNPNSLISDRVETLLFDAEGMLWIGSFDNGLQKFDPTTETFTNFTNYHNDSIGLDSRHIRALAEDQMGGIWIGTIKGLFHLDAGREVFSEVNDHDTLGQMLKNEHIRVLHIDSQGTLWAGTSSPFIGEETQGGLYEIDVKTHNVRRYAHSEANNTLSENTVTAIFEDHQGILWIGTTGDGLHEMQRENGTFVRHIYDTDQPDKLSRPPLVDFNYARDHIRFIIEDASNNLWIGTLGNGINRYNPALKTMQHFGMDEPEPFKTSTDNFWGAVRTRDDLIWIYSWLASSNNDVLLKVNLTPTQVRHYDLDKLISYIESDLDGNIYLGSVKEIIKIDARGDASQLCTLSGEQGMEITHLNIDKDDNIWVSTTDGLYRYNIRTEVTTSFDISPTNETFVTTFADQEHLLVGCNDGLYVLNTRNEEVRLLNFEENQIKDQSLYRVSDILKDSKGDIWIGYYRMGMKKLDWSTQQFIDYSIDPSGREIINKIFESSSGDIYVGMMNGLRKYDADREDFEVISDESGNLDLETPIYDISALNDSSLWLVSGQEIIKYNLFDNTTNSYGQSWISGSLRIFSNLAASRDYFYLGTGDGFLKFKPDFFNRKSDYRPTPFISNIKIEDSGTLSPEQMEETIVLEHTQNDIAFTLGYINLSTSLQEDYLKYKLENHDKNWRNGSNEEVISYYQIPPGSYTFKVQAKDIYGDWDMTSMDIEIRPPWYRTWWSYLLFLVGIIAFVRGYIGYRGKVLISKNKELEAKVYERTSELNTAKKEVERSLEELKATQAQLIQSEKLASLGELTAGIAHEIQNPLNFVNNFSEVSAELIDEVEEELAQGDVKKSKIILNDLKENINKISHHGERASSIVKGMLDHSRTNSGKKVPTDINALCDEYVRLAYHGLRAKDKNFNASFITELDRSIPKLEVVPQEIGRVLLNLINNAFQAVSSEALAKEDSDYQAEVIVSTRKLENGIEISVSDNGPGIPEEIKDKIFQPFFTTKPTGQGTGLGLSLAYDIVKSYGGKLTVHNKRGEGSEFTIILPTI